MICTNCNEQTEPGKFCTKCGAPLDAQNAQEPTVPNEPTQAAPPPTQETVQPTQQQQQQQQTVDFAEKTKEVSSNFGSFFMNTLKQPSSAKNVNGAQFISGIISIVVFALIISVNKFVNWRSDAGEYGGSKSDVTFFDYLAVPFLKYVLLYAIIVVLVFAATRVAQQTGTIQDIIAKYGAYLVPFVLLYVLSIVLDLIDMTGLPFSVVGSIAMFGPVLIIPILILSEKTVKGFDYIYTAIILVILTYVTYRYIENSVNDIDVSSWW